MTEIDKHIKILLDKKDLRNPTSFEELGYVYLGPLIFNFFIWMIGEIDECDLILFNSREGHFLKQIYEIFQNKYNLPKSVYFKTSRKLSSIVSFFNKEDIYKTFQLHRFEGNLSSLLKNRFGVEPQNLQDKFINTNDGIPNIDEFVYDILENSESIRKEYGDYIKSVITTSKNIVMIDSGYQGMTQENIEKVYGLKFKGRYFLYKGNANLDDVKGFCDFKKSNLQKNLIFFESIFIDNIGTYIGIKNNKFVNEKFDKSLQYFEKKEKIIQGIKHFLNDMFNFNIEYKNASYEYSDYIFNLMCQKNYVKNESFFHIFFHDNYYVRDVIKQLQRI